MKNLKLFIVIFIPLFCTAASGQNTGTTGAAFLKLGAGARAVGMGTAFTGLSDDATAIYWNPAGLVFTRHWEMSFNYQKLFADFTYQAFFCSHQLRLFSSQKAALGFGMMHLGISDHWNSTDPNLNIPGVSADAISDLAVLIPFAYPFDIFSSRLALGVNYKFLKNKLANYTAHSHGMDLGLMYKTDLSHRLFLSLGSVLQNITLTEIKFIEEAESLPLTFRFGSALKYYLSNNQDVTLAYDISRPKDNNFQHNLGLEYWLHSGGQHIGVRGGYRILGNDLGKLSFSIGYGVDFNPTSQKNFYSQIDYTLKNYDSDLLGNVDLASFSIEPTNPAPFSRLYPKHNLEFTNKSEFQLSWEKSYGNDAYDTVNYFVAVDHDSARIYGIKKNAKYVIKQLVQGSSMPDLLFYEITRQTRTKFTCAGANDFQKFYWLVIAFNRNLNFTIATGSDEIGKFTNENLPDIKPISLDFTPTIRLDTPGYQGMLQASIIGLVQDSCNVVIYDSTELKTIVSSTMLKTGVTDTFTLAGDWFTLAPGLHKISVIADSGNLVSERNETNNILTTSLVTVPTATISVDDTVKLEELSYDYVELPTLPFIFFESNSTDFSQNSQTGNETDPDSLLRLLGQRLRRDFPGLKIVLRGYVDLNSEKRYPNNSRLALLRAQKVQQKLIAYGARDYQIQILQDHQETKPSLARKTAIIDSVDLEMINEENRRVEIGLPDDLPPFEKVEYERKFFAPRLIVRNLHDVLSKKIEFNCKSQSSAPLKRLTLLIKDYQDDPFPIKVIEVDTFSGNQNLNFYLTWDGVKDNEQLLAFNKHYFYTAILIDSYGNQYRTPLQKFFIARNVIVKQRKIFALAKFNQVAPLHQFYLKQLDQVKEMLKRDRQARVRFLGHADIIGTENHNAILSVNRAMEVAGWLAKIIDFDYDLTENHKQLLIDRIDNPISKDQPAVVSTSQFGRGEHVPLIINNIEYGAANVPQGRTLNRRVDIEIYRLEKYEKPLLAVEKTITFHPWYRNSDNVILPSRTVTVIDVPTLYALTSAYDRRVFSGNPDFWVSASIPKQALGVNVVDRTEVMNQNSPALPLPGSGSDSLFSRNMNPHSLTSKTESGGKNPTTIIVPTDINASLINNITAVELHDSLLWLGTQHGLLKWNLARDTYQVFAMNLGKYKHITALKYDSLRHCLWVGTHKGLRQLPGHQWAADVKVQHGLSGNRITKILITTFGTLFVATNEGINYLHGGRWKILANIDTGLDDDYINDIYEDHNGVIWLCTNSGIYSQAGIGTWEPFEGNIYLPSDTALCMIVDSSDNKWIGSARGLVKLDANNQPVGFAFFDLNDRISTTKIYAVAVDSSQTVWCATADGLSACMDNIWYTYNYSDGVPATFMKAILVGHNGKKYVATDGGGIAIVK